METKGTINVIVHKHSTAADVLQSFVHAHVMASLMDKSRSVHTESQSWMDRQYETFLQKVNLSLSRDYKTKIIYQISDLMGFVFPLTYYQII